MEDAVKFTVEEAKLLTKPCTKFHWTPADNTYGIEFGDFRLRDHDAGITLVELTAEQRKEGEKQMEEEDDWIVKYDLGPDFLDLGTIGMEVQFKVGEEPVKNLLLIEKHYFKDELLKAYEFEFGFWIPNSTNTWENIYELPELDDETKLDIITNPYETKSDSFFFIEDQLVIHQRCVYSYDA